MQRDSTEIQRCKKMDLCVLVCVCLVPLIVSTCRLELDNNTNKITTTVLYVFAILTTKFASRRKSIMELWVRFASGKKKKECLLHYSSTTVLSAQESLFVC